jgi:predicted dehydrogenase
LYGSGKIQKIKTQSYILSDLRIGFIGAGHIAREHLKVVQALDGMTICGITSRTRLTAEKLAKEFGSVPVYRDPVELVHKGRADALLVLVSAENIFSMVKELCPLGLPLFIEKPPGLSPKETSILADCAKLYNTSNMVGFNRRFYSVFHKGIEIIKDHGSLLGVVIEGHERFWKIKDVISETLREQWGYANSTHTIDLLRFFGGEPQIVHALANSHMEKNSDQFSTTIAFESGALGNYSSHWYSPGGWSIRLFGEGVTVEFKPLENGRWIDTDFKLHEIVADQEDINFKPGFFKQIESFGRLARGEALDWPAQDLCGALKTMELTKKISG